MSEPQAKDRPQDAARALSPRQRDTLTLLLQGLSDKEVASRLGISRHTVNEYVKGIYLRLGVHSRGSLFALWLLDRAEAAQGDAEEESR